jgi:hypothetical protein
MHFYGGVLSSELKEKSGLNGLSEVDLRCEVLMYRSFIGGSFIAPMFFLNKLL